jgi:hypothetical protein
MKQARHAVDRAHDALEDAMMYTEQMLNAKQTMEEEMRVLCSLPIEKGPCSL